MARHLSRGTRKKLIVAYIHRVTMDEFLYGVTSHDVAHEFGMAPSSHLNGILREMVNEGILHVRYEQYRSNVQRAIYTLTRSWIDSKEKMQSRITAP